MQGLSRPLQTSAKSIARCLPSSSNSLLRATRPKRRKISVLTQKSEAEQPTWEKNSVPPPLSAFNQEAPQRLRPDPYVLVGPELKHLRSNLLKLLGSAHPGLTDIAEYYFLHPSKQLRSLLVLLFSRATNGLGEDWNRKYWEAGMEAHGGRGEVLDRPLYSSETLNEGNPSMPDHTESFSKPFELRRIQPSAPSFIPPPSTHIPATLMNPALLLPTQMRLAQIVEMIHIGLVMHENIQDKVDAEGNASSSTTHENPFGNKLSILGGDFLLGRASTVLSRLGESEVVELVASVISNIAEGEFLRMDRVQTPSLGLMKGPGTLEEAWERYLRKTYLKSASLMAKGARASVILGGCRHSDIWQEVAYAYGRNLGIANQLMKDALKYDSPSSRPSPALATAPAIYAWEERPELGDLISRNFTNEGDIELAADIVRRTSGIERTRILAYEYAERARDALRVLPDSDAKMALEGLTELTRSWL